MPSTNLWFGYKYRRSMLNLCQQKTYDLIHDGLKNNTSRITLCKDCNIDYPYLFKAITYDNPLIFNVDKFTVKSSYNQVILEPKYKMTSVKYLQLVSRIDNNVNELLHQLKGGSNWDTINSLHDYIVDTFIYDEIGDDSHSIVGPATMKIGVCEGISKYVKLVCDALCIKCVVISGTASTHDNSFITNDNHSWNAIQLAGQWYYFDFTFDLSLTGGALNPGSRRYDYYAIDQQSISIDHNNSDIVVQPSGKAHDYFTRHHMIANNQSDFASIVQCKLNSGVQEMSIKISNTWSNFDIKKVISTIINLQSTDKFRLRKSVSYAYNDFQNICFLKFE